MGTKKGNIPWNKGKIGFKVSEVTKKKISEKNKDKKSWNSGTSKTKVTIKCLYCGIVKTVYLCGREEVKYCSNKCAHIDMGVWNKGKSWSTEVKDKIRKVHLGVKHTEEHTRNCLKRNLKSTLEIKFENLVNELKLPYVFVGNGEKIISGKVPDFINTNKNIAVEVFYKKHKDLFRGGCEEWMKSREQLFKENGWKLIFFNETEVNRNNILNVLIMEE